jgi:hypothetical protein
MFRFIGLSLTVALAVCMSSPRLLADTYGEDLKAHFEGLYTSRQFAVLTANRALIADLTPVPLQPNSPSLNGYRWPQNYITAGVETGHSEMRIMGFVTVMKAEYKLNEGISSPLTNISLYTTYIPCNTQCAPILGRLLIDFGISGYLYYNAQWEGDADGQAYASLLGLQLSGWTIERVCNRGSTDCWTFQRKLRDCLMQDPIVCAGCAPTDKKLMITNFINVNMPGGLRAPANWGAIADAELGHLKHAENVAAFVQCSEQAARYPVGIPLK